MAPVSTQPLSNAMNVYSMNKHDYDSNQCQIHLDTKGQCACAAEANSAGHRACHQARLRKLLLPVAFLLVTFGAALAVSCVYDVDLLDIVNLGADISGNPLGKRDVSNGQSTFTRHKLYLIIIFVGLFLVLIAGIMLAFCCCKSSFENPCCCPCYLCACCGGLACLECVGCGLCAAGLEAA